MKIINEFKRDSLGEGRSSGMGFGFAKKLDEKTYETVQPVSCCKDYLNDCIYAEHTGEILPIIYGFKYREIKNIIGDKSTPLVIRMEGTKYDNSSFNNNYLKDLTDNLDKNYKNIESLLNQLEDILKLEDKTKILKGNDGMFVMIVPNFWVSKLYLLSLYTLLTRAYYMYDGSVPAREYITTKNSYSEDMALMKSAIPKINRILDGEIPEQPFIKKSEVRKIHNKSGIINFEFPKINM